MVNVFGMWNRISVAVLFVGGLLPFGATYWNYFYLSEDLQLAPADRLSTSIDVFIAMITAVGVVYAGLSLKQVSTAQSDTKTIEQSRYIQEFLDEWELDVEKCLIQMRQDGVDNRLDDLKKMVWYFRKAGRAMKHCKTTRSRLREHLTADYWVLRDFLNEHQVASQGMLPEDELREFDSLSAMFKQR